MTTGRLPDECRILLLGAKGQVGRELLQFLSQRGEVIATVRSSATDSAFSACLPLDLTNQHAIRRLVRQIRPRLIVNAAAYTAVDQAETDTAQAMAVNAIAPGVLAAEARALGAALIHFSTDYVFNGCGHVPWKEEDGPEPLNAYGRSKLAGEAAIRASGAAHLIVRTSWVYGVHGQNFVKTMLRLGAERPVLRVVCDQVGAPTSAREVAQATIEILRQLGSGADAFRRHGGTLHLACAGEASWHGFAEEIFHLARNRGVPLAVKQVIPIPAAEYPTPAQRPLNSRLDCTRLYDRFRLQLPHWRTALEETMDALCRSQPAIAA